MAGKPLLPTEQLVTASERWSREHRVIYAVAVASMRIIDRVRDQDEGAEIDILDAFSFFNDYVERMHLNYEEKHLFPWFAANFADLGSDLVDRAAAEHEESRVQWRTLTAAYEAMKGGAADVLPEFLDYFQQYLSDLRSHVAKEQSYLYALLEQVLTPDEQGRLRAEGNRSEVASLGPGAAPVYERRALALCARYGVPIAG
jgi:hemerythrin-like domain-containing protein